MGVYIISPSLYFLKLKRSNPLSEKERELRSLDQKAKKLNMTLQQYLETLVRISLENMFREQRENWPYDPNSGSTKH